MGGVFRPPPRRTFERLDVRAVLNLICISGASTSSLVSRVHEQSEATAFRGLESEKDGNSGYFWQSEDSSEHEQVRLNAIQKNGIVNCDEQYSPSSAPRSARPARLSNSWCTSTMRTPRCRHTCITPPTCRAAIFALTPEELAFLDACTKMIAESGSLKEFLRLGPDEEMDLCDVPTVCVLSLFRIGLGGSGGGMRANLGFITTIIAFQELGLWPNLTYVAGVSGAYWGLPSMYTLPLSPPLTAPLSVRPLLEHFKQIVGTHPLSTGGVKKVARAEGGVEALLGLLTEKRTNGQEGKGGLIRGSFQRCWTGKDSRVITAVRHERPWHDWKSPTEPSADHETANL
ncbi:hypothetical protein C8R44DRAFT_726441 [Mycena epipterygia]|nr:hypothetical protein C8R44DRAFT_726441 [Mycena epipterygia]